MEYEDLIDELDSEINGKRGIFSKKVDIERCGELITAIKNSYPGVLRDSAYIVENREKILSNADVVAKNTIREAEEHANHLVGNSELLKKAETEAKKIIDSAYSQCDVLVERTKDHLDNVFKDVEQFLMSTLNMVRNNRDELKSAVMGKKSK